MECVICRNNLSKCDCEDLEERLDSANLLAYKRCRICLKHYERCGCLTPAWYISSGGVEDENITMNDEQASELGGRHPSKLKKEGQ